MGGGGGAWPPEGAPSERPANVVSPAETGRVARARPAGTGSLTALAHEPDDVCYYPRSNIARLEPLGYFDREPA